MGDSRIHRAIEDISCAGEPRITIIKRDAVAIGGRVGVFAASFNPTTNAHLELMRLAAESFSLDEILALAGSANADKLEYECSLEDRVEMLRFALRDDRKVSIGLSSHAFYADMVDPLERLYPPGTDLHFIVGFDTFERVIDTSDRYTPRYHRKFGNRRAALNYLFRRCRFIVASRGGAGREAIERLLSDGPTAIRQRVFYLDTSGELAGRSATEVRERIRTGQSVAGLIPPAVEKYIEERRLYR